MLFNSWAFWLFFAVVLPAYWALPHKAQNRMLLVSSYFFYGCWNWRFVPLILFSTALDYCLGNAVATASSARSKKACIIVSVAVNLGLLGIFKYYGFFASELASLLSRFGLQLSIPVLHVVLPVGISFYTFQSISYVFDIYRGVGKPATTFLDFALYVAFFPHLVAGPIMRSGLRESDTGAPGLLKQIVTPRAYRDGDFKEGLYHILIGLYKKIAIGDNLAPLVSLTFRSDASSLSGPEIWAGVYAFAFQIYADFSGYSSIAQGLAKWMGFDLMANFRMPYFADSPSEFWRRWHISLSTWLRDYVYISFGGNRQGERRTYRNLMLTMLLGGMWHGANWTFLAWGGYHGALLCAFRASQGRGEPPFVVHNSTQSHGLRPSGLRKLLRIAVMFQLICIGWLLFRADSMQQAGGMLATMLTDFRVTRAAVSVLATVAFYAGPMMLFELWIEKRQQITPLLQAPWLGRALAYSYGALMLVFFPPPIAHEFIYFQF
jgi:D-alanyl-lipoteichoic acid acyltransferase DltB (MBOAT superfamily)